MLFRWGVTLDTPSRANTWAICTEVNDHQSRQRHCTFTLDHANQDESYFLTHCRRLGANKLFANPPAAAPAIRFAVWAPNAQQVELVLGDLANGYIANNGNGITKTFPMFKRNGSGVWETDLAVSPDLANYGAFDHAPYMFKITKDNGTIAGGSNVGNLSAAIPSSGGDFRAVIPANGFVVFRKM